MKPLLILSIIFFSFALSANIKIDSLKINLSTQVKAEKMGTLLQLSVLLREENNQQAIDYAKHALQLASELKLYENSVEACLALGQAYESDKQFPQAIAFYRQAGEIAEQHKLTDRKGDAAYYQGIILEKMNRFGESLIQYYHALECYEAASDSTSALSVLYIIADFHEVRLNYDKAIHYYLQALHLAEKIGEKSDIAHTNNLLGNFFSTIGNSGKAKEFYQTAYQIYQEDDDLSGLAMIYNNLAIVFEAEKNRELALEYYKKALTIEEELGLKDGTIYNNIGDVELQKNNLQEAIHYFLIAVRYAEADEDKSLLLVVLNNLAEASLKQNKFSQANDYLQRCLQLLKDIPDRELEALTYFHFSSLYEKQNAYKKAFQYLRQYSNLQDSIYFYKSSQELTNMQIKLEMEEKEQEIELIKKDKKIRDLAFQKQQTQRNFIGVVLVLSLIMLFLAHNRYQFKKRSNEQLKNANSQILQMNDILEKIARTDPLTNLANRRGIQEKIEYEITRFKRSKRSFSIALVDIDDFKNINDTYGHDIGDFVLQEMALLFESNTRKQDVTGRWGGEEFLFLLPETDTDGAVVVTENQRKSVSQHLFSTKGLKLFFTVTIGICTYEEGISLEKCLKIADERLYLGKKKGKNCVVWE